MRILLMFFLVPCTWAQTAAIPPLDVPIPPLTSPLPAVVDKAWTLSCPVTGKTATCKMPQRTLLGAGQTTTAPAHSSTAQITVPVQHPGTLLFTCTATALPDGQPDLTKPLVCTAKAQ